MATKGSIHVLRSIPGRVRFRFNSGKSGIINIKDLKNPGINEIKYNTVTNTLLVTYNPDKLTLDKLIFVVRKKFPEIDVLTHDPSRDKIQIIRKFPGRLRVRSENIFKDPKGRICRYFVEALFGVSGVQTVRVNNKTMSALILYDLGKVSETVLLAKLIETQDVIKSGEFSLSTDSSDLESEAKTTSLQILDNPLVNINDPLTFTRFNGSIGTLEITHDLPGRLRIKQPLLFRKDMASHQIETNLMNTPGIEKVSVNPLTSTVLLKYDYTEVTRDQVLTMVDEVVSSIPEKDWIGEEPKLDPLALSTTTLGLTILYPWMLPLNLGLIAYTSYPIFKKATSAIKQKKVKVDILDATVISGCVVMRQYSAAAFMIWILDVADKIYDASANQSKSMLTEIFGKSPKFAWVIKDKEEVRMPIDKIKKGDIVSVSIGEQIPIDGIICDGEGAIDQHRLTGESAPVEKKPGDQVYTSTVLLAGKLHLRVETTGDNTIEAQIRKIIEESSKHKVKIHTMGEKLADKMVLPTLGLGALGTILRGPNAALAIINADYGTGIRVAAPTAVFASVTRAARHGIVIKKGTVLEELTSVDVFLFDKTGTLTHDVPVVANVISCTKRYSKEDIIKYSAAAEERFTHPIAKAILAKAEELKLKLPKRDESKYDVGFGITVGIDDKNIKVGSERFMEREKITVSTRIKNKVKESTHKGGSAVFLAIDNSLSGVILLESSQRAEAFDVIQGLKKRGKDVILISGDHETPTRNLAGKLGIEKYFAGCLPQDKAEYVKKLKKEGKKVAMIGDGINDSVAMSLAEVSISMRGASDIATDVADVIFMDGDLTKFPLLFEISEGLQKNVKRSFSLILIPNTVCVAGAMMGVFGLGASLLLNNTFNLIATINAMSPLAAIPIEKQNA